MQAHLSGAGKSARPTKHPREDASSANPSGIPGPPSEPVSSAQSQDPAPAAPVPVSRELRALGPAPAGAPAPAGPSLLSRLSAPVPAASGSASASASDFSAPGPPAHGNEPARTRVAGGASLAARGGREAAAPAVPRPFGGDDAFRDGAGAACAVVQPSRTPTTAQPPRPTVARGGGPAEASTGADVEVDNTNANGAGTRRTRDAERAALPMPSTSGQSLPLPPCFPGGFAPHTGPAAASAASRLRLAQKLELEKRRLMRAPAAPTAENAHPGGGSRSTDEEATDAAARGDAADAPAPEAAATSSPGAVAVAAAARREAELRGQALLRVRLAAAKRAAAAAALEGGTVSETEGAVGGRAGTGRGRVPPSGEGGFNNGSGNAEGGFGAHGARESALKSRLRARAGRKG
ncbi:uncharacterized protein BXZ73DRAFT_99031 [Epithele typhae]|uniref:uncharacterized protein n=1 Tax=Epithele typhae TaxID=378194 RepID=UPI002007D954|nr:uncharacterized protein BXZ73DRAFT_99031 [Epithele typhae]KAH9940036.1 hypothetical protein BXZ73DRAFT_99031 [Epithele typhae]